MRGSAERREFSRSGVASLICISHQSIYHTLVRWSRPVSQSGISAPALREHAEGGLRAAVSETMDSHLLMMSGVSSCFSDAVTVKRRWIQPKMRTRPTLHQLLRDIAMMTRLRTLRDMIKTGSSEQQRALRSESTTQLYRRNQITLTWLTPLFLLWGDDPWYQSS